MGPAGPVYPINPAGPVKPVKPLGPVGPVPNTNSQFCRSPIGISYQLVDTGFPMSSTLHAP